MNRNKPNPSGPSPKMLRCMMCQKMNRLHAYEWHCTECKKKHAENLERNREEIKAGKFVNLS